jgi:hypothetical protein
LYLVGLNDIVLFDVVEAFEPDAALEPFGDFANVLRNASATDASWC